VISDEEEECLSPEIKQRINKTLVSNYQKQLLVKQQSSVNKILITNSSSEFRQSKEIKLKAQYSDTHESY